MEPGRTEGIDYDGIAAAMGVLSNANRLRILRQLLSPRTVSEIRLEAEKAGGPGGPASRISRQGVRQHLEKLMDLKVVQRREARRDQGPAHEYLVDPGRLFALGEEFRKLGRLRPRERWATETMEGARGPRGMEARGPSLVLVHGVEEGRSHLLSGGGDDWTVGRAPQCDVTLAFDPYVSSQNCRITRRGGAFYVEDLPTSRNGTLLNWRPVPAGEALELEAGDVLGVGQSLLVFRR